MKVRPLLFRFSGRINRSMFWLGYAMCSIFFIAFLLIGLAIDSALRTEGHLTLFGNIWIVIASAAYAWMFFAICTKRFHDHGSSALWCLILFIPAVGLLFFIIELGMMRGDQGHNKYGASPHA